jgi:hypothetical protein
MAANLNLCRFPRVRVLRDGPSEHCYSQKHVGRE